MSGLQKTITIIAVTLLICFATTELAKSEGVRMPNSYAVQQQILKEVKEQTKLLRKIAKQLGAKPSTKASDLKSSKW